MTPSMIDVERWMKSTDLLAQDDCITGMKIHGLGGTRAFEVQVKNGAIISLSIDDADRCKQWILRQEGFVPAYPSDADVIDYLKTHGKIDFLYVDVCRHPNGPIEIKKDGTLIYTVGVAEREDIRYWIVNGRKHTKEEYMMNTNYLVDLYKRRVKKSNAIRKWIASVAPGLRIEKIGEDGKSADCVDKDGRGVKVLIPGLELEKYAPHFSVADCVICYKMIRSALEVLDNKRVKGPLQFDSQGRVSAGDLSMWYTEAEILDKLKDVQMPEAMV